VRIIEALIYCGFKEVTTAHPDPNTSLGAKAWLAIEPKIRRIGIMKYAKGYF